MTLAWWLSASICAVPLVAQTPAPPVNIDIGVILEITGTWFLEGEQGALKPGRTLPAQGVVCSGTYCKVSQKSDETIPPRIVIAFYGQPTPTAYPGPTLIPLPERALPEAGFRDRILRLIHRLVGDHPEEYVPTMSQSRSDVLFPFRYSPDTYAFLTGAAPSQGITILQTGGNAYAYVPGNSMATSNPVALSSTSTSGLAPELLTSSLFYSGPIWTPVTLSAADVVNSSPYGATAGDPSYFYIYDAKGMFQGTLPMINTSSFLALSQGNDLPTPTNWTTISPGYSTNPALGTDVRDSGRPLADDVVLAENNGWVNLSELIGSQTGAVALSFRWIAGPSSSPEIRPVSSFTWNAGQISQLNPPRVFLPPGLYRVSFTDASTMVAIGKETWALVASASGYKSVRYLFDDIKDFTATWPGEDVAARDLYVHTSMRYLADPQFQ